MVELFWVDPSIAISTRPRGGDRLDDEMVTLRGHGVQVLVSCLTPAEELELDLDDEGAAAGRAGLTFIRSSIADGGIPADTERFAEIVARVTAESRAGRRVAIHCWHSLGRAPLVAASVLVSSGMEVEAAWRVISVSRGRVVPESAEQREWVGRFRREHETRPE